MDTVLSSKTEHIKAIVLKKTKLAEADLIITFLKSDGSQVRAVAKGARKPESTFSSRLELCSHVEVLLAKGKNLDIVREAKLINPYTSIRKDIDKISAVSPVLELLSKATNVDLPVEALFPLTLNFLDEVDKIGEVLYSYLQALCAAHIIKTCSYLGFRPRLTECINCNKEYILNNVDILVSFSFDDGGVVCANCSRIIENVKYPLSTLYLVHKLIHARFNEIALIKTNDNAIKSSLQFCKSWVIYYLGIKLNSLKLFLK